MTLTLSVGGREVEQHPGFHPNDRPKAGLYWLANFLREQGLGLHAGQHVITGSYAGFLDVPAHQDIELVYGELGVPARAVWQLGRRANARPHPVNAVRV